MSARTGPEDAQQDRLQDPPTDRADRAMAVPDGLEWHRMHPITPLLQGWKVITAVLAIITLQNLNVLLDAWRSLTETGFQVDDRIVLGAVLLPVGLLVVMGLVLFLAWRVRSYGVDADAVYLRSGLLNKKLRIARLPRIQSVDVVHPLLGRILGLGQLTVEVAGGGDSRVVIGYLRTSRLEELRDRILDLAAGINPDQGDGADLSAARDPRRQRPAGPEAEARPRQGRVRREERALYVVDISTLLGATIRSGLTIAAAATWILLIGGLIGAFVFEGVDSEAVVAVLPAMVGPLGLLGFAWGRINQGWGFNASATPAGIRVRYGLTSETSSTLPPGRVHGVGIAQGPLWRGKDWWKVEASVAGRSGGEVNSSGGVEESLANVLLPVGNRDTALRALWLVVPDLGVPDPDAVLEAVLSGRDDDGVGRADAPAASTERGFIRIPRRARLFSPLTHRRKAILLTDTCVVLRLGRWRRYAAVIPFARVQSVSVRQGPWARRRGLATIRLDMVDTSVRCKMSNLAVEDAAQIERIISERALRRSRAERLDRWLERVS